MVTNTLNYTNFDSLKVGQEFFIEDHGRPNSDIWIKINESQAIESQTNEIVSYFMGMLVIKNEIIS